jgi:hypothetical protein
MINIFKIMINIINNRKKHIGKKEKIQSSFIPIKTEKEHVKIVKKMKEQLELENDIQKYMKDSSIGSLNNEIIKPNIQKVEKKELPKKPFIKSINDYNGSESEKYNKTIEFLSQYDYYTKIVVCKYPTENCQLSSVGRAIEIIYIKDEDKKEFFKILKKYTTNQIIFDIKEGYIERFELFIKDYMDIVTKTKYNSTNGSNMNLYIYKWKKTDDLYF